jgi:hypothetical protein
VQKNTQRRKAEADERNRRSTYGVTSKAARKSVARSKRHRNRSERRLAHASFGPALADDPDAEALASARVLRKHRTVSNTPSTVPPGLLTRAMLAKREMMAFASKKLRQLLGRAGG